MTPVLTIKKYIIVFYMENMNTVKETIGQFLHSQRLSFRHANRTNVGFVDVYAKI